jgi:hypothetical protein
MRGGVPTDEADEQTLLANGFISAFDKHAFDEGAVDRFEWGNSNAQTVRWRLERYGMTDVAVATICDKFDAEPCAHRPRDALITLFAQNPTRKGEFQAAATRLGKELPALIPTLK